jgi:hypothetical protein
MIDSENKPYFTSFSAKYSALTPDDKKIVGDCIYSSEQFRPDLDRSKRCLDPV